MKNTNTLDAVVTPMSNVRPMWPSQFSWAHSKRR